MERERSRGVDWDYQKIGRAFDIAAELAALEAALHDRSYPLEHLDEELDRAIERNAGKKD
jgi:hypothetical protein